MLLVCAMASADHGEENLRTNTTPYQFAGDTSDNTPQGLDVEFMNAIAAHAGMTVRWVEAPEAPVTDGRKRHIACSGQRKPHRST